MYRYRVTKYNPFFRDSNGIYLNDEWTSVYDVISLECKYSFENYMIIENEYVKMVELLVKHLESGEIKFIHFEEGLSVDQIREYQKKYFVNENEYMLELYNRICNNMSIQNNCELTILVRMILREYLWGEIKVGKNKIKFGYDYYMYFITQKDCFEFLENNGGNYMFIEKM